MTASARLTGFDGPIIVRVLPNGTTFQVRQDVTYYGSHGDSWHVPAGFRSDLATIPAAVSWAVPKLGAYTLAAIVHDVLCEGLNDWHRAVKAVGESYWGRPYAEGAPIYHDGRIIPIPTASAVDTDAIFYKIARDYGVDPVTANLLWLGVRWGALANPARREGWLRTAPAVLGLSLLYAPVLLPASLLAVVGRGLLRAASTVNRFLTRRKGGRR